MPKIVDHEQRKKEILEVSLKLFATQGMSRINLATIAKECGISRPTLYQYFKDKDEIFQYALKSITDTMLEQYHMYAESQVNTVDTLKSICSAIIMTAYEKQAFLTNLADIMFQLRKNGKDFGRDMRKRTIRLNHLFFTLFQRGIAQQEIREIPIKEIISQIFAMMEAFAFQMAIVPEYEPQPSMRVLDLYLESLRNA